MITEDFAAYAARITLDLEGKVEASSMQRRIEMFMSEVTVDCLEAGSRLIGHIKSMVESGNDFLACSVTDHQAKVRCRGSLTGMTDHLVIIINVLQYGLPKNDLERIVMARVDSIFQGTKSIIEDLEPEEVPAFVRLE